jgi:hypothetical protein
MEDPGGGDSPVAATSSNRSLSSCHLVSAHDSGVDPVLLRTRDGCDISGSFRATPLDMSSANFEWLSPSLNR